MLKRLAKFILVALVAGLSVATVVTTTSHGSEVTQLVADDPKPGGGG
jgi:hypothetical protein